MVGSPYLLEAHGMARFHFPQESLGQLDRLDPSAERLREETFHDAFQPSFEVVKDAHGLAFSQVSGTLTDYIGGLCPRPFRHSPGLYAGHLRWCMGRVGTITKH